uniref:Uncharacterized protein n=1 Tax=Equus asinus asinus TaxID=83772 RepID=A0A8C4LDS0_EQUAS
MHVGGLQHIRDWGSARDHYEKISPLVSESRLLKENLAKLEFLGKNTFIREKKVTIYWRHPQHLDR